MEILYTFLSILIILVTIFILVLFVTTLSVYNEVIPEIKPNERKAHTEFLKELSVLFNENTKLDDSKYANIYTEFIEIVPKSISYNECVKLLVFKKNNEYTPNKNNEKLIKELIDYYKNYEAYTLVEFLESLLTNIIVSDKRELLKLIAA